MIDWLKIRNEYINTSISYRKLADKYKISFATIRFKAKEENWVELRTQQQHKTSTKLAQKTQDKIVTSEVNRIERITSIADTLLSKLEQATEQLDQYIVTNKVKVKNIEYDNVVKGKPKKEVITETEKKEIVGGIIDKQGLKVLVSALKDIKEIAGVGDNNTDDKVRIVADVERDKD